MLLFELKKLKKQFRDNPSNNVNERSMAGNQEADNRSALKTAPVDEKNDEDVRKVVDQRKDDDVRTNIPVDKNDENVRKVVDDENVRKVVDQRRDDDVRTRIQVADKNKNGGNVRKIVRKVSKKSQPRK